MDIGLSTYTFPWHFTYGSATRTSKELYEELFQRAVTDNIGYIQFGDNFPLHVISPEGLGNIKALSEKNNIGLQVGTRRLTMENILKYIDIAKYFKSPFVRIIIDDEIYEPTITYVKKIISGLLPSLKEESMMLAIENHDRFRAAELEEIMLDTDPAYVGICLDTANSFGCGEGISTVVERLAPYTVNLHVKDFSIKRMDHKMGFVIEGSAAGDGMLDIKWLLDKLSAVEKCETATLEIWSRPLSTKLETLAQEIKLYNKSIQFLKQYLP